MMSQGLLSNELASGAFCVIYPIVENESRGIDPLFSKLGRMVSQFLASC